MADDTMVWLAVVVVALILAPAVLMVAWWVLVAAFNGYRVMFEWASQYGPIAIAALVAFVVFMFPVSLTMALVLGFLVFVGKHS